MTDMKWTVLTSENPPRLTKRYFLLDGDLHKDPGGQIISGHARICTVSDLKGLADALKTLTPKQALCFGLPPLAPCKIITSREWDSLSNHIGVYTRSRQHFNFWNGPGFLFLDIDPDGAQNAMPIEDVISKLKSVAPDLFTAGAVFWPSSSSHICSGDKDLTGPRGIHIFVPVADASDIPRAAKSLCDRLWLAGLGHIKISSCGSMLERTIIDDSVHQPERMAFASGAYCEPPLEQRRGEPTVIYGVVGQTFIDTRKALPDLCPKQIDEVSILKRNAKAAKQPEAKAAREAWVVRRSKAEADQDTGEGSREEKIARARQRLERALDGGVLNPDFILHVLENGQIIQVTVCDVLAHKKRFHLCETLDPLEPGYDDGRIVGKLFLNKSKPRLHSFAMGGRVFELGRPKTRLLVVGGNTHELTDQVLENLRTEGDVFDRGGLLVEVIRGKYMAHDKHVLAYHLGHGFQWEKNSQKHGIVQIDPPMKVCEQILALALKRNLRSLQQVVTAPLLLPNRRLLAEEGYDADSGLYLYCPTLDEIEFVVPEYPSAAEVQHALGRIWLPFLEFPFTSPLDRGVYLAALLTAALRPGLGLCPAFGMDAPEQGSGKTLLAKCVSAIASDETAEVIPTVSRDNEEEIRKRLFALLLKGRAVVLWDNLMGKIDSPSLAALLTAETYSDRKLGISETSSVPNRTMFLLSGNNLTPAGDLPRRIAICRIEPRVSDPYAREFDLNPETYCRMHRLQMVRDLLTLVRGYWASDAKPASGRVQSFEEWDGMVRQTVAWVGKLDDRFADPIDAFRNATISDPVREQEAGLFSALVGVYGSSEFSAEDLLKVCDRARAPALCFGDRVSDAENRLANVVRDFTPPNTQPSSRKIGGILRYRKGRIAGGAKLIQHIQRRNVWWWRIEIVDAEAFGGGSELVEEAEACLRLAHDCSR